MIELLIVIVILGILAAIVVFAVNGIQNRGTAAACKADVETVTVAAEAYDAQNGQYADTMDQLVKAGLLHSVPSNTNYTIDYKANNGDNPNVSVSSSYCADAATNPTSSEPPPTTTDSSSGSNESTNYCDLLQSTLSNLSGLDIQSVGDDGFNALIKAFDALAAAAPDGIAQDWQAFADALRNVQGILHDAGLHWSDLNDAESGNIAGLSPDESAALTQRIQDATNTDSLRAALQEIGQDANANCSLALGGK